MSSCGLKENLICTLKWLVYFTAVQNFLQRKLFPSWYTEQIIGEGREIMAGDIISGLSRSADSILTAAAIAIGSAVGLAIVRRLRQLPLAGSPPALSLSGTQAR